MGNGWCVDFPLQGDIVSGGGRSISLGDYSDEWKMHRRLVHSALQRCTAESLHSVIQQQALKLRQVRPTTTRTYPQYAQHPLD